MRKKSSATDPYWRIIDANTNRLKEGLRVIEDIVRFHSNDPKLTSVIKTLRHDVSRSLLAFPIQYRKLLDSRDSATDVGSRSRIQDKKKGQVNFSDLLIANFKRSQESCRVLEEISKIESNSISSRFQKIRFKLYDAEKRIIRKT